MLVDKRGQMDRIKRTNVDERRMELRWTSNETTTNVQHSYDGCRMELWRLSDITTMDVGWNFDARRTKLWRTSIKITTKENWTKWNGTNGNRRQWMTIAPAVMTDGNNANYGVEKRKKNFFSFTSCFFLEFLLLLLLLPELLQGLLTTWLQIQKHTRVHNLDANFKPMYKESKCMWGCIT